MVSAAHTNRLPLTALLIAAGLVAGFLLFWRTASPLSARSGVDLDFLFPPLFLWTCMMLLGRVCRVGETLKAERDYLAARANRRGTADVHRARLCAEAADGPGLVRACARHAGGTSRDDCRRRGSHGRRGHRLTRSVRAGVQLDGAVGQPRARPGRG